MQNVLQNVFTYELYNFIYIYHIFNLKLKMYLIYIRPNKMYLYTSFYWM